MKISPIQSVIGLKGVGGDERVTTSRSEKGKGTYKTSSQALLEGRGEISPFSPGEEKNSHAG